MKRWLAAGFARRETVLYLAVALATMAITAIALELWRMSPSVPLSYFGDALTTATYLDNIRETGWYERQPNLGWPFGLVFHDYPAADHLHLVLMGAIMAFTPKFGLAMNMYYLLGYPLAAVTATWLFRTIGIQRVLAGALAVVFAIAPYHLRRTELHLFLSSYWPIPLFLVLVVRVLLGRGLWNRAEGRTGVLSFATWQNAGTLLILVVAGSATQYYALFDLLLLGLAALMALVRDRSWRRLLGSVVAGATVAFVLLLNMLPDLVHSATTEPSYGAADRPAEHTEWFAIKIALLFMPPETHRFGPFADLAQQYNTEFTQYTLNSVGLIAGIGVIILFVALTAGAVAFAARRRVAPDPRRNIRAMLSGLLLWVLVVATSGGLSVFIALLVTTKVRGWDRLAIYIALLGLAALGLSIQLGLRSWRRRTSGLARSRVRVFAPIAIAAVILGVGYWDQTSPAIVPTYEQDRAEFTEDATYAAALEGHFAPGSALYMLPYQPFPEGPFIVNNMTDYDQIKLSLFTESLAYSYGGVKGRPSADWPIPLGLQPTSAMVDAVTAAGFAGITVYRPAYADRAQALEAELSDVLGRPVLTSENGTYATWDLAAHHEVLVDRMGADAVAALGYGTLHPVIAYGVAPEMTNPTVNANGQSWSVRPGVAELVLASAADHPRTARVSFYVGNTYGLQSFVLELPDGTQRTVAVEPDGMGVVVESVEVPPGAVTLRLIAQSGTGTDYAIVNLQVSAN